MRSYWVTVGPNLMVSMEEQREEGHVTTGRNWVASNRQKQKEAPEGAALTAP